MVEQYIVQSDLMGHEWMVKVNELDLRRSGYLCMHGKCH